MNTNVNPCEVIIFVTQSKLLTSYINVCCEVRAAMVSKEFYDKLDFSPDLSTVKYSAFVHTKGKYIISDRQTLLFQIIVFTGHILISVN